MADFWEYIRGLFRQAEQSSPSQPLIHELIQRSEAELADYERWKDTLVCRRLLDWLNDQFAIYRVDPDRIDEALDFLDTPSSKGFVVHFYKTRYSRRDMTFLFDLLKERVLALGYRTQVSDTRTYQRPDWVETVERHYLKPRPAGGGGGGENISITYGHPTAPPAAKFRQEFGNITIELHRRDDRNHYLKLRATSYRDHLFEEAREFKDLMQVILG